MNKSRDFDYFFTWRFFDSPWIFLKTRSCELEKSNGSDKIATSMKKHWLRNESHDSGWKATSSRKIFRLHQATSFPFLIRHHSRTVFSIRWPLSLVSSEPQTYNSQVDVFFQDLTIELFKQIQYRKILTITFDRI